MKNVVIGISIYKQPFDWIVMAVKSVINQSYRRWQLKIRVDGKDGLSKKQINALQTLIRGEKRAKLILGEERLGCFGSYRQIFDLCEADYLAQLDADDMFAPDALLRSVEVLEKNQQTPFTYSLSALINEQSDIIGYDKRALAKECENIDLLMFRTFHLRVIRNILYQQCGGYNADFMYAGDYDLSLKLAEYGTPVLIKEPLYLYRVHTGSSSQRNKVETHREGVVAVRSAIQRRRVNSGTLVIQSPQTQTVSLLEKFNGPIIITGMHRSGTSILSHLLQKCIGIDLGKNLLPADTDNIDGYHEDFLAIALHSEWFDHSLTTSDPGWTDWGFNGAKIIGSLGERTWDSTAKNYISLRESQLSERWWGWKDPRSSMVMPYWHLLLGGKCLFVCIYRAPWDVSDSLQRLKQDRFRKEPLLALEMWKEYNNRIIEYCRACPEHACLIASSSIVQDPDLLSTVLDERWGLKEQLHQKDELRSLIRNDKLITIRLDDPLPYLYKILYPDIFAVWQQLNELADVNCTEKIDTSHWQANLIEISSSIVLSIIITTYNPSNLLLEAIASVLREGGNSIYSYEIIIVDDGSTLQSSLDLINKLDGLCGIRVLRQRNQGLACARNNGITESQGRFILPLDDDNKVLAPYMRQAITLLSDNKTIDMVYGDRDDFGAAAGIFCPGLVSTVADITRFNRIDACAVFRRTLWEESGGYDPASSPLEDWDLWLNALGQGKNFHYLHDKCFEYRVREGSMLRNHLLDYDEHSIVIDYLRNKHNLPLGRLDGR